MERPLRVTACERCAYCGSLLPTNIEGVEAWRLGNKYVCNEFCADGIPDGSSVLPVVATMRTEQL